MVVTGPWGSYRAAVGYRGRREGRSSCSSPQTNKESYIRSKYGAGGGWVAEGIVEGPVEGVLP